MRLREYFKLYQNAYEYEFEEFILQATLVQCLKTLT